MLRRPTRSSLLSNIASTAEKSKQKVGMGKKCLHLSQKFLSFDHPGGRETLQPRSGFSVRSTTGWELRLVSPRLIQGPVPRRKSEWTQSPNGRGQD